MVTALVLQLIQCVVHLPNDRDMFEECDKVGKLNLVFWWKKKHTSKYIICIVRYTFNGVISFRLTKMC